MQNQWAEIKRKTEEKRKKIKESKIPELAIKLPDIKYNTTFEHYLHQDWSEGMIIPYVSEFHFFVQFHLSIYSRFVGILRSREEKTTKNGLKHVTLMFAIHSTECIPVNAWEENCEPLENLSRINKTYTLYDLKVIKNTGDKYRGGHFDIRLNFDGASSWMFGLPDGTFWDGDGRGGNNFHIFR